MRINTKCPAFSICLFHAEAYARRGAEWTFDVDGQSAKLFVVYR